MIILPQMSSRFDIIYAMGKNAHMILASAALAALASGCFSLETAPLPSGANSGMRLHSAAGVPREHVVVANDGWYLFNAWPLATGNPDQGAWMPFRLFRDCVHEDILQDCLTRYASERGYDVSDMILLSDEQVLLSIPGSSLPIPIPYILTYRRKQFSAVMVKYDAAMRRKPPSAAEERRRLSHEMKNLLEEIPDGDSK